MDVKYFLLKTGLPEGILSEKMNSNPMSKLKERRFWSRVDPQTILYASVLFNLDAKMFAYSFEDYLKELHLTFPSRSETNLS